MREGGGEQSHKSGFAPFAIGQPVRAPAGQSGGQPEPAVSMELRSHGHQGSIETTRQDEFPLRNKGREKGGPRNQGPEDRPAEPKPREPPTNWRKGTSAEEGSVE